MNRLPAMNPFSRILASFASILLLPGLLTACATLNPGYEQPTVTLSSFNAVPSEGMVPAFEIGLRIINPNSQALSLEGIVYTISLQGHELVKGVGKDFPVIEGYSEGLVKLTASANLLAGIRFIGDMMGAAEESLEYEFKAKLDLGGIYPSIRISETGHINLGGNSPARKEQQET
jgi:LEA14-like dessication related protein